MSMSKQANAAYRNEVLLALHAGGFPSARRAPELRGVPEDQRVHGDVLGIDGVTIAVRRQRDLSMSEAAHEVEREAKAEGNDLYVSVQHRRGHPVEDSYATMPLSVLLRLLRRALLPV